MKSYVPTLRGLRARKSTSSVKIQSKPLASPRNLDTLSPTGLLPQSSQHSLASSIVSDYGFRRKSLVHSSADFTALRTVDSQWTKLTVQKLTDEQRKRTEESPPPAKDLKFLMELKGKIAELEQLRVKCFSMKLPMMNDTIVAMRSFEHCLEASDWNSESGRLAVVSQMVHVE